MVWQGREMSVRVPICTWIAYGLHLQDAQVGEIPILLVVVTAVSHHELRQG
jgi:hypothetical protein